MASVLNSLKIDELCSWRGKCVFPKRSPPKEMNEDQAVQVSGRSSITILGFVE